MTPADAGAGLTIRPLRGTDLDAVVAIDRSVVGRSRIPFYDRRLAHLERDPDAFVALAAEQDGAFAGFALARLYEGEFGGDAPEAALDAIGVAAARRGQGIARTLLAHMVQAMRAGGVHAIATEAEWSDSGLIGFFIRAGFCLSPHLVLERRAGAATAIPGRDEPDVSGSDFSAPDSREAAGTAGTLAHDRMPVRSLRPDDLRAILRIDRHITGRDRSAYYARKLEEAMRESAVRVSLVAEIDRQVAGFIMARVDFGEFGNAEPEAVMDTIGVEPGCDHRGVASALLSQLLTNLGGLRVEKLRTKVAWNQSSLIGWLDRNGFRPGNRLALRRPVD